ncbi:hypothetical protein FOA52_004907 [Chlamydomonas sp. UWO 241]|nr:hypothetical protein FOA52_004907 [Chlamydomonas sp. UWO 241]
MRLGVDFFLDVLCRLPRDGSLDDSLGQALFDAVCSDVGVGVTEADVVVAKARCERLSIDEAEAFGFAVLSRVVARLGGGSADDSGASTSGREGVAGDGDLVRALCVCARLAVGADPPEHLLVAAVAGLARCGGGGGSGVDGASGASGGGGGSGGSGGSGGGGGGLSLGGYRAWAKVWPALHHLLTATLLRGVGSGGRPRGGADSSAPAAAWVRPLPQLLDLGRADPGDLLLQPLWAWLLSGCLPADQRVAWCCVFSSQRDGRSFNTMMGRLAGCQAPSLLLVRDSQGYVFGGYAAAPWAKSGSFFGDHTTFVFRLLPQLEVFRATGYNDQFQWCGAGFRELPSGVGFGGAAAKSVQGQFALYLDSSLDSGMSRPVSTFGNEPLSAQQVFQVSCIECWQLRESDGDEGDAAGGADGGAFGAKAQADRVLMSLAGMQVDQSDGYRGRPEPPIER